MQRDSASCFINIAQGLDHLGGDMIRTLLLIANLLTAMFFIGVIFYFSLKYGFLSDTKGLVLSLIVSALAIANTTYMCGWVQQVQILGGEFFV